MPSADYVRQIAELRPVHAAVKKLGAQDAARRLPRLSSCWRVFTSRASSTRT